MYHNENNGSIKPLNQNTLPFAVCVELVSAKEKKSRWEVFYFDEVNDTAEKVLLKVKESCVKVSNDNKTLVYVRSHSTVNLPVQVRYRLS